jgi:mannose/fructose/N-acetylgalactosamine-specific phosphotransferase system component IIB
VVEGWLPVLRAKRILVVSNEAAEDETQVALMKIALPDGISLDAVSVENGAAAYNDAAESKERVLVLAPGPSEVLGLVRAGAEIKKVNVGGLHYAAGHVQLGKAIYLSREDVDALAGLSELGVLLEGRAVPTDKTEDGLALMEEKI